MDLAAASALSRYPLTREGDGWVGPVREDLFGVRAEARVELAGERILLRLTPTSEALALPARWEALEAELERYFGPHSPPTARVRLSLGLVPSAEALEERFLDGNPLTEGTATDARDPDLDGTPSFAFGVKTLHTGARIAVTAFGNLAFGTVWYTPVPASEGLAAVAAALGAVVPADLPLDALLALGERPLTDLRGLVALLSEPLPTMTLVPTLLACGIARAEVPEEVLDGLAAHGEPEVRRAAVSVAGRSGQHGVLTRALARESHAAVRQAAEHYLARGPR